MQAYDLLVVGGGINGAAVARDAAGRGLSVCLVEAGDPAGATSGASSKLIHGGLRYLEYYEFGLVKKALAEREVMLKSAPHIIRPMRFVMPHDGGTRPAWLLRAGLFLYDHLARRELLPGSESLDLRRDAAGMPLRWKSPRAFAYWDTWVDDARLVVSNAIDAREHDATVLTRTRCTGARRATAGWQLDLRDASGIAHTVQARALVNAAGPWVDTLRERVLHTRATHRVRLIRGSHIVVPRIHDHDFAYLLQNPDRRILFAIPWEGCTVLGTTDVEQASPDEPPVASGAEIGYLCAMAARWLRAPIDPDKLLWAYSGVRSLLDDAAGNASAVTRDYLLDVDTEGAPLLTVYGGKITTARVLAEEALHKLQPLMEKLGIRTARGAWTATASLPGGDLPANGLDAWTAQLRTIHPWLSEALAQRWARTYGTRTLRMLEHARGPGDLGALVGDAIHEIELAWLIREEWATGADDVLWRRTKLGLHAPEGTSAAIGDWMRQNRQMC